VSFALPILSVNLVIFADSYTLNRQPECFSGQAKDRWWLPVLPRSPEPAKQAVFQGTILKVNYDFNGTRNADFNTLYSMLAMPTPRYFIHHQLADFR
jgi:hypothetical protein